MGAFRCISEHKAFSEKMNMIIFVTDLRDSSEYFMLICSFKCTRSEIFVYFVAPQLIILTLHFGEVVFESIYFFVRTYMLMFKNTSLS